MTAWSRVLPLLETVFKSASGEWSPGRIIAAGILVFALLQYAGGDDPAPAPTNTAPPPAITYTQYPHGTEKLDVSQQAIETGANAAIGLAGTMSGFYKP